MACIFDFELGVIMALLVNLEGKLVVRVNINKVRANIDRTFKGECICFVVLLIARLL